MSDLFAAVKAIPIESVVREYYPALALKPAGHDLISNCPLHDESTPSFYIYLKRNSWHCFGACAKGGSAIDLLLNAELASTPVDAAKELARKFGIDTSNEKPTATGKIAHC